jgi:hypothetical protein
MNAHCLTCDSHDGFVVAQIRKSAATRADGIGTALTTCLDSPLRSGRRHQQWEGENTTVAASNRRLTANERCESSASDTGSTSQTSLATVERSLVNLSVIIERQQVMRVVPLGDN